MPPSTLHSMSRSAEERPRCGRAFCRVVLEMLLTITPTMRPLLRLASPVSGSASYAGSAARLAAGCSPVGSGEAAIASEDAAEEAAPEEQMPSVCWSQLEKLLPRMALPEALQLESASEAAAAPVRRRTVRRVIFIGKTSCKKRIGAARQNAKAGKKFAGAARRGAHCWAVKRSALQTDLI